jgi:hypothetical protein
MSGEHQYSFIMGYLQSCFEHITQMSPTDHLVDFAASKRSQNCVEVVNSKYYRTNFSLAVPIFAARISGVFADVVAHGNGSWNF